MHSGSFRGFSKLQGVREWNGGEGEEARFGEVFRGLLCTLSQREKQASCDLLKRLGFLWTQRNEDPLKSCMQWGDQICVLGRSVCQGKGWEETAEEQSGERLPPARGGREGRER